jgi:hypothetical protein
MEASIKDLTSYKVSTEIALTPKENEIFDTLMSIVKENNLKTTLRVAGGWVRDKVSQYQINLNFI